jgi:hypothetical protein
MFYSVRFNHIFFWSGSIFKYFLPVPNAKKEKMFEPIYFKNYEKIPAIIGRYEDTWQGILFWSGDKIPYTAKVESKRIRLGMSMP